MSSLTQRMLVLMVAVGVLAGILTLPRHELRPLPADTLVRVVESEHPGVVPPLESPGRKAVLPGQSFSSQLDLEAAQAEAPAEHPSLKRSSLPTSIADPLGFARSMEALYEGESKSALKSTLKSLRASMPLQLGHEIHWEKARLGDCEVVSQMVLLENGMKQYSIPPSFQSERQLYLDQIQSLEDGSVVTTRIELLDIAPYADRVAEINWLRARTRTRSR